MLSEVIITQDNLGEVNEAKKKREEREESEKRRYLDVGFIKEIEVAVNNLVHTHFVENDYCTSGTITKGPRMSYMWVQILYLTSYTWNSWGHNLYSSKYMAKFHRVLGNKQSVEKYNIVQLFYGLNSRHLILRHHNSCY